MNINAARQAAVRRDTSEREGPFQSLAPLVGPPNVHFDY
jgi:hypothetical protein